MLRSRILDVQMAPEKDKKNCLHKAASFPSQFKVKKKKGEFTAMYSNVAVMTQERIAAPPGNERPH